MQQLGLVEAGDAEQRGQPRGGGALHRGGDVLAVEQAHAQPLRLEPVVRVRVRVRVRARFKSRGQGQGEGLLACSSCTIASSRRSQPSSYWY